MSGVEILGIATAVLQNADLGSRVSVKLFGFARKVKGATEKVDFISKDIAATGALLRQLSEQLDKDGQAQLLGRGLVETAYDVVRECKRIFQDIDQAIDGKTGNKIILSLKQKIRYTYLEPEIDALRMNLESLNSSIGIMYNVLIYAEQLRNRERYPVLKEQQDVLKTLGEEKLANEQRYNNMMKAIKRRDDQSVESSFLTPAPANLLYGLGARSENWPPGDLPSNRNLTLPSSPKVRIALEGRDLRACISLVAHILDEVHLKQYNVERSMRWRVHDGVLDLHWRDGAPFRQYYSDSVLLQKFTQFPELREYWAKKLKEQEPTQHQQEVEHMERRGKAYASLFADDYEAENVVAKLRRYEDEEISGPEPWSMKALRAELEGEAQALKQEEMARKIQDLQNKLRIAEERQMKKEREEIDDEGYEGRGKLLFARRRSPSPRDPHGRAATTWFRVEKRNFPKNILNLYDVCWEMDPRDPRYLLISGADEPLMEELVEATHEHRARAKLKHRSSPAWSLEVDESTPSTPLRRSHSGERSRSRTRGPRHARKATSPPSAPVRRISETDTKRAEGYASLQQKAANSPKAMDIQSLLLQWTTLTPWEISQGNDSWL